jgi:hypothetical protein
MTDQDFFFHYDIDPSGKKKFSNLCLLRRDINTCFGKNPNDPNTTLSFSALWPGTMAILAGIDLLAKFYSGDDNQSKSKDRFICYTKKYIDETFSKEIYQLRNSMLHSFGLYGTGKKDKDTKESKIYRFVLNQDNDYIIKYNSEIDKYYVSIKVLHEKFEESIAEFSKEYQTLDSYKNFNELFEKYGITEIG